MIKVNNLSFSYNSHEILSDINFTLEEKKILAVLGANGVGKTTLLRILAGLVRNYKGSYSTEKEITYVPQIFTTGVNYTVFNMVLLGRARHIGLFSSPDSHDRDMTEKAIRQAGIEGLAERRFSEISGGEKQLTLVARALASDAEVLLLDEPTSDLDIKNQGRILELMSELSVKYGFSIIFTTHDPSHALAIADRTIFLGKGGLSEIGDTEKILTKETIKRFYSANVEIIKIKNDNTFYTYCLPIYNINR